MFQGAEKFIREQRIPIIDQVALAREQSVD
jgi:hypothetical protein